jgi:hypothetical protein
MEGLGHGAEVLAQAARLGRADGERAARGVAVEAKQLRCRGGRADRAAGRGAVEAVLVVARHDRLGDLALDLHADLVGEQQVRAAAPVALGERQRRRQGGSGGMGEQAVDAVLRDRELRVVVVVGMHGEAVGEGGEARGQPHVAADHRASLVAGDPESLEVAPRDMAALRGGAGERETDAVEHRALAEVGHVLRDVGVLRVDDEGGGVVSERHGTSSRQGARRA